jgi:hypothetical protein
MVLMYVVILIGVYKGIKCQLVNIVIITCIVLGFLHLDVFGLFGVILQYPSYYCVTHHSNTFGGCAPH